MKTNKISGIVTKIEKHFIIVKTKDSKIERIKYRKNIKIGDSIDFNYNDIYKGLNKINYKKIEISLSMVLIIILAGIYFLGQFNTNKIYGVISLDVNPSIELEIDKNEKVLAISKKNDDSNLILNKNIIGKDINIALTDLISDAYEKNIISKSDPIVISYVPIEKEDKLLYSKKLNSFIQDSENLIIYIVADELYLEKSNDENITVGKNYIKDQLNQINKIVIDDKNFIRNSLLELNNEFPISEDTKIIKIDIINEIIEIDNDPIDLDDDIDIDKDDKEINDDTDNIEIHDTKDDKKINDDTDNIEIPDTRDVKEISDDTDNIEIPDTKDDKEINDDTDNIDVHDDGNNDND